MPASDYNAQALLNIERGTTYTAPSNRYFALLSAAPDGTTADALAKEISGTGYARVTVPSDTSHWSAPNQPGGVGTPWQISNVNAISWGNAGSAWGTVAAFAEFDSGTVGAGNFIRYWAVSPALNIINGQLVQIAAGLCTLAQAITSGAVTVNVTVTGGSNFPSTVTGLSPIRYYRMNAAVNSGTETDLGSQAQNGTYSSAGISQVNPGLLPVDTGKACLFASGSSGKLTIPNTSLPTGANPWTFGCIFQPQDTAGINVISWNGVNLLYGSTNTEVTAGAGVVATGAGGSKGAVNLAIVTYDGTTLKLYIGGILVGSATVTLALSAGTCTIGSGTNAAVQEAFWFNSALSSTNVANLWSAFMGH